MTIDIESIVESLRLQVETLTMERNICRNANEIYDTIKHIHFICSMMEVYFSNNNTQKAKKEFKDLQVTVKKLVDLT